MAAISQPSPRDRHVSAPVEGKVYTWGGGIGYLDMDKGLASTVHCFNPLSESWETAECSGVSPPGLYGGACASAGHLLYVYGGEDGRGNYSSSLHQLDLRTETWSVLSSDGPMEKGYCGILAYSNHLVLFGGRGVKAKNYPIQPGAKFTKSDEDDSGYINDLYIFDLNEGENNNLY